MSVAQRTALADLFGLAALPGETHTVSCAQFNAVLVGLTGLSGPEVVEQVVGPIENRSAMQRPRHWNDSSWGMARAASGHRAVGHGASSRCRPRDRAAFPHLFKRRPALLATIIDAEPHPLDDLSDHQHLAFPNILFAERIWDQIARFDGSSLPVRRALIANLGGLEDHALRIWAEETEPIERIKQMQIAAKVDCSPESPNTHKNAKAMRQRLVEFNGEQISCEWHAKLERHRNRIHFAVRGGHLYVGLFANHLLV